MSAECESGNCGSRRFHVGEDGFTYCSEGHRQSQTGLITIDDDAVPSLGRRTIRRGQNEQEAVILHGKDGLEHYILCVQLLLWKQVSSMIKVFHCPTELETVVRDLWTVQLSTVQSRLATADRDDDRSSQLFSSQGETSDSDGSGVKRRNRRRNDALPGIMDAVCLVYAGSTLLRLPILVSDIYRWIQEGQLIYYRSTQHLNPGMKASLAGFYHRRLDPIEKLGLSRLHAEIHDTLMSLTTTFGMDFPPLNHQLCLWRWVQSLCLPLEVYPCTLQLASTMDIDFFHAPKSAKRPRTPSLASPEHRLAALLVIATKLVFPSDNVTRAPRRPTDPAALSMDWRHWSTIRSHEIPKSAFREAFDTGPSDVPHMSAEAMDRYMAWFGEMYGAPSEGDKTPLLRSLHSLFPVPAQSMLTSVPPADNSANDNAASTRELQSRLQPVRVLAPTVNNIVEYIDRPGSGYVRFRRTAELNKVMLAFYTQVAKEVETTVEVLVADVFALERNLYPHVDAEIDA